MESYRSNFRAVLSYAKLSLAEAAALEAKQYGTANALCTRVRRRVVPIPCCQLEDVGPERPVECRYASVYNHVASRLIEPAEIIPILRLIDLGYLATGLLHNSWITAERRPADSGSVFRIGLDLIMGNRPPRRNGRLILCYPFTRHSTRSKITFLFWGRGRDIGGISPTNLACRLRLFLRKSVDKGASQRKPPS